MKSENETEADIVREMRNDKTAGHFSIRVVLADRFEAAVARREAAHKRDVAELCDTLRRLAEYTCVHCDARYCEEPCQNGEPKMPCSVIFDSLQVANRFDPPPKPTTADDEMPF